MNQATTSAEAEKDPALSQRLRTGLDAFLERDGDREVWDLTPRSQADPASMTRLMAGLDEFLERDQDRALFDLPPRPKDAARPDRRRGHRPQRRPG